MKKAIVFVSVLSCLLPAFAQPGRAATSDHEMLCAVTINQGRHVLTSFTFRAPLSGPDCENERSFAVPETPDTYRVELACSKLPDVIDLQVTNLSSKIGAETRAQAPEDLYVVLSENGRYASVLCKFVP